jgi:hypothetical protein
LGFFVRGKFDCVFSRRIRCFCGVFFAGGGLGAVVSGQWLVEAAGFFVGKIQKMHVFLDPDVPYWMAVGGVLVDSWEVVREGEGFFSQRN